MSSEIAIFEKALFFYNTSLKILSKKENRQREDGEDGWRNTSKYKKKMIKGFLGKGGRRLYNFRRGIEGRGGKKGKTEGEVVLYENDTIHFNIETKNLQWKSLYSREAREKLKSLVSKVLFDANNYTVILFQPAPHLFGGMQTFSNEYPVELVRIKQINENSRQVWLETKQPLPSFFSKLESSHKTEQLKGEGEETQVEQREQSKQLEDVKEIEEIDFSRRDYVLLLTNKPQTTIKEMRFVIGESFLPLRHFDDQRNKQNSISLPSFPSSLPPSPSILFHSQQNQTNSNQIKSEMAQNEKNEESEENEKNEKNEKNEENEESKGEKIEIVKDEREGNVKEKTCEMKELEESKLKEWEELIVYLGDNLKWNEEKKYKLFHFLRKERLTFTRQQKQDILSFFKRESDIAEVERMFQDFANVC